MLWFFVIDQVSYLRLILSILNGFAVSTVSRSPAVVHISLPRQCAQEISE